MRVMGPRFSSLELEDTGRVTLKADRSGLIYMQLNPEGGLEESNRVMPRRIPVLLKPEIRDTLEKRVKALSDELESAIAEKRLPERSRLQDQLTGILNDIQFTNVRDVPDRFRVIHGAVNIIYDCVRDRMLDTLQQGVLLSWRNVLAFKPLQIILDRIQETDPNLN